MSLIDATSSSTATWALAQAKAAVQKGPSATPPAQNEESQPPRQTIRAAQDSAPTRSEGEEPTAIETIREQGFQAYAEEVREEKMQELREKILASMGFTEEDLEAMPPEQRKAIEKVVANEIIRRLMAQSEFNGGDDDRDKHMQATAARGVDGAGSGAAASASGFGLSTMPGPNGAAMDEAGVGLGPLLALQEVEDGGKADSDGVWRDPGERGKNGRLDV